MRNPKIRFIEDLEKFRNKFPFPFKSQNKEVDFLLSYNEVVEDILKFCDHEFNWFSTNQNRVKSIFKEIHELVSEVIKSKLNGDDENGLNNFNRLMEEYIKPSKKGKKRGLGLDEWNTFDQKNLFRIRAHNGKSRVFCKNDLFHISLKNRRKCKNYRFSISGTPVLYLADSIELCENEVFNDGEISKYYVSQFVSMDHFKLVTIDFPELAIWNLNQARPESTALRFFAYIPFTISCLFKTAPPHNHVFNPEYIIPQMLINHVRENKDIDGVRYPSTKYIYDSNTKPVFNYAFPIKEPDEKDGFCKNLKRIFDWTDPVFSEIDYGKMNGNLSELAIKIEISDDLKKNRDDFGAIINKNSSDF